MLRAVQVAVLGGVLAVTAAAAPATAAADVGFEDFNYAPLSGSPTGSKPESKLWFNDGIWWASMFDTTSQDHHIFRLDRATEHWTDTGTAIDPRVGTRADTLWTGSKLYVTSHVFTTTGAATTSANAGRLWRFSYNATTKTYTRDAGFPVDVNAAKSETLVIDRDSTGRLWATWTLGSQVWVNHTTTSDTAWGTPYVIPGSTTMTNDDISSLIAFGGNKIGVMWSNQADHRFWFAVHADGGGDTAASWKLEAATTGSPTSDDHINLKTDAAGRIYAATKTSESTSTQPLMRLLVRSTTGTWSGTTFGTVHDSNTRPIVLVDEEHSVLHVFATCPQPPKTSGQSGGDICEKTSPLGSIAFASGNGKAVISDAGSPDMNDTTSTKQNVSSATGIVIEANNATTLNYWHADISLGAATPPPAPPAASFTATPTTGNAPLSVAFTDTSTGSPTTFAWNFGDGTTSSTRSPSHTYTAAGQYTVTLTATNAGGSSTSAPTTIVVNAPAPTLRAAFTATRSAADPLTVDFADASTGGTPTSWSWTFGDGGTATVQNPSHTYAAAGTYTVTLKVSDGTTTDSASQSVTVGSATTGTLTFAPVADTQVKSDSPNTNYGTLTSVRVRQGNATQPTTYRTFLKFQVSGVTGTVTDVKLRLFVTDPSPDGGTVYQVSNNWAETTFNWNGAANVLPATGIASAGRVTTGTTAEIDLGTAVTGDGVYSFALASNSTDSAIYSSREGANPPALVLTTG
jgi:PKD repeat protein